MSGITLPNNRTLGVFPDLDNMGLVGWYSFEDGTVADHSGAQNNGSIVGAVRFVSGFTMPFGLPPGALGNFATNTYAAVPSIAAATTNFTVSFWINMQTQVSWQTFYVSGTQANNWNIGNEGGNLLTFTISGINDYYGAQSVIPLAQWCHCAVVKAGNAGANITMYINGVAKNTLTVGSVTTPSGGGRIGNNANGNGPTTGYLDDFRVYTSALAASDIRQLYLEGLSINEASDLPSLLKTGYTPISFPMLGM